MKTSFNKYWIIMAGVIIINIFIFIFFSKKLEIFVMNDVEEQYMYEVQ